MIYWINQDKPRQAIRNIRTMHRSGLIELEAVMAVARRRSFRAAARDMGMSTSALSNAVIGLEERLGVRLSNRTTRSVALTEAGQEFIERVAPALSEIRVAIDVVSRKRISPKGILRINSSVGAARQALLPLVLEYLRRHPEMEVVVATDGRLVDIVADGWDAGIRTLGSVPRDMVSVPVCPAFRFIVVGSPAVRIASLPVAVSVFPGEICRAPRRWAEACYGNLFSFNELTTVATSPRVSAALAERMDSAP